MREIRLMLYIVFGGIAVMAKDKPNVVFILSDDQSWDDYGFMGHPHLETPNLDQLAGEGFLYERGYTTASICRPSLASIVTGLYPHQTAVRGNRPFMGEGIDHRQLRRNKKLWPLAQEQSKVMTATLEHAPSMVRQLQDNGYATLQTGKWWEGDPLDHGFDEGFGHAIGRKTMEPIHNFVDKAQKNAQPFFIWYAVFLPHTPHNAPDRHYLKYKDLAPNESTARYWANIAWLDETCGQLVDFLKEKNLYDNTLSVRSGDNGVRAVLTCQHTEFFKFDQFVKIVVSIGIKEAKHSTTTRTVPRIDHDIKAVECITETLSMSYFRKLGQFLRHRLGSCSSYPFPSLGTRSGIGDLLNSCRIHLFTQLGNRESIDPPMLITHDQAAFIIHTHGNPGTLIFTGNRIQ